MSLKLRFIIIVKIAMINLAKLSEMPANKYEIMIDEINYSCECLDVRTKDMIESFGHKIYVEVNYLV